MNKEEMEFHTKRVAFMIINDKILYLRGSTMSHREWFNTLNLSIDFNVIIRGFFFNNKIVFYKGNFGYDEETINIAQKYYEDIINELNLNQPELWVGQKPTKSVNPITDPWPSILRLK